MGEEAGVVVGVHSVDAWTAHIQQSKDSKKLVVVDFTATWCGPCRTIAPFYAELAKKFPDVTFLKVDVDELQTVAQEWQVSAMPTFIFVKEGKILDTIVGARKAELEAKIPLLIAN